MRSHSFIFPVATVIGIALLTVLPSQARDIQHAMGITTVPDAPKRIVILTNEGTEALLDLGIIPIAAVRSTVGEPWYPHIAAAMAGVDEVGSEDAPNLEVIAALQPDLIIGIKARHEAIYKQLSAMAPTVMSSVFDDQWLQNYQLYATALGLEEEGKAHVAAFEERIAALRHGLGDRVSDEISLVRFRAGGRTSLRAPNTFAGDILRRIGFARPAAQGALTDSPEITKERIPEMDGDAIFYFTRESGDGEGRAVEGDWTNDPLWLNLSAVKSGRTYRVDDAVWNIAGGVLAAHLILNDLAAAYQVDLPR